MYMSYHICLHLIAIIKILLSTSFGADFVLSPILQAHMYVGIIYTHPSELIHKGFTCICGYLPSHRRQLRHLNRRLEDLAQQLTNAPQSSLQRAGVAAVDAGNANARWADPRSYPHLSRRTMVLRAPGHCRILSKILSLRAH
jgi:hypothetical protein